MSKINPIKIGQLDRIGVDEKGRLYWDNRPVVTEEKIKLQWWVNVAIILGSLSTAVLATIELLRFCGFTTG